MSANTLITERAIEAKAAAMLRHKCGVVLGIMPVDRFGHLFCYIGVKYRDGSGDGVGFDVSQADLTMKMDDFAAYALAEPIRSLRRRMRARRAGEP